MKKLLLTLAFCFASPAAWAQCTGVFPTNTVCGNVSGSPAPPSAVSTSGIGLTQNPVTTTYTIQNSDCGNLVTATNGFYIINFGAPGGYGSSCRVTVVNNDPMPPSATGAKIINVNGINGCISSQPTTYLWPLQSMEVTKIGSTWQITRCPGRWVLPAGIVTFNTDPVNGSDSWGAADGLSTGARAFASIDNAMYLAAEMFKNEFVNQTQIVVLCSASCTDNQVIHWPPHNGIIGAQGRAGITVDCNNGTLTQQVALFFSAAIVEFQNCSFTKGTSISEGSELILNGSNNTFVPVSGDYIFNITSGGQLRCNSCTINLAAGTGNGMFNVFGGGGNGQVLVNQTGNVTWTDTGVRVQASGFVSIPTWVTNGHTTTGTQFVLSECGILEGSSNVPGSAGSFNCTQAN